VTDRPRHGNKVYINGEIGTLPPPPILKNIFHKAAPKRYSEEMFMQTYSSQEEMDVALKAYAVENQALDLPDLEVNLPPAILKYRENIKAKQERAETELLELPDMEVTL
jgi:hypothetical protein